MKTSFFALIALAASFVLTSCVQMPYEPYARSVKVQPKTGGVVAVRSNFRPEDKQKAMTMMAETCGNKKPEVTEEGEVVTGQTTMAKADAYNNNNSYNQPRAGGIFFGQPANSQTTTTQSTTTAEKEWQMTYKCM